VEQSPEGEELIGRACCRLRAHGFGRAAVIGLPVGCGAFRRVVCHVGNLWRDFVRVVDPEADHAAREASVFRVVGWAAARSGVSALHRAGAPAVLRCGDLRIEALERWRFRVNAPCFGRAQEPGTRGVVACVSACARGVSSRFRSVCDQRQEGNGAGDGERLREGSKALKGATP
jgi:hypothetical protein